MFLSIVIPVYNSAKYLPKCLDSIWSQVLPEDDYEVLCVDDCSTDNSLEVLQKESELHPQLRILRNPVNLRAGGARNYGVREARGEYIQFIDSDDYFHPNSLHLAYEYQKEHCLDILVCDSSREIAEKPSDTMVHNFPSRQVLSGRLFMMANSLPFAPWKYFFRKSLMVDNKVWFEENVNCEDVDWTHKLAFYAKSMQYQPILLTHYVLLPESETRAEYKNINTIRNRFFCASRVLELRNLFDRKEEQLHLEGVALSTYKVGIKSMCASFASPRKKSENLSSFLVKDCTQGGFDYRLAVSCPKLFSIFSTIVAPATRVFMAVWRALKNG